MKKLKRGTWTKEDIKKLRKIFGNNPTVEVAAELGRPVEAVKKFASRLGLRKTRKYMAKLGR